MATHLLFPFFFVFVCKIVLIQNGMEETYALFGNVFSYVCIV
jgi:hypothetical protein